MIKKNNNKKLNTIPFPCLFVFNKTTLSIVNFKKKWLTELRFSLKIFVKFYKHNKVIIACLDQNLKTTLLSIR